MVIKRSSTVPPRAPSTLKSGGARAPPGYMAPAPLVTYHCVWGLLGLLVDQVDQDHLGMIL